MVFNEGGGNASKAILRSEHLELAILKQRSITVLPLAAVHDCSPARSLAN